MKVAKEFKWEMGHRLPFHEGLCKNLHGHSYKLMVEFTGEPDNTGIVIDYYDIKKVIQPLIEKLDHSFLVNSSDKELIEVLEKLNSRHVAVDFETTAENICRYFLKKISSQGLPDNITNVKVRIFETESVYAEDEASLI